MSDALSIISATASDIKPIIDFLLSSGDGLYEYYFQNMGELSPGDCLKQLVSAPQSGYGFFNWRLAQANDMLLGGICICPAILLQQGVFLPISKPAEKLSHSFDCVFKAAPLSYHIVSLAVKHLYQDVHIGTALIQLAWAEAKMQGYTSLSIFVRSDNIKAYSLYKKLGFKVIEETPQVTDEFPPFYLLSLDI